MKKSNFMTSIFIIIVSISSLGCLEYTNHLSSDFTTIGTKDLSIVNDSNISISYNCVQQKINLNLYEKYTIRGNITNIGNETISVCELNAFFFRKNNAEPKSEDNSVEPIKKYNIEPNETVEFIAEKSFLEMTNIKSYKITLSY